MSNPFAPAQADAPQESIEPLKLLTLSVKNHAGIEDVKIEPGEKYLIAIGGDNAAGKSSLLSAIVTALFGKPDLKVPIRKGEKESEIELVFDRIRIRARMFFDKNDALQYECLVSTPEDALYERPYKRTREVLDKLLTHISFDIGKFLDMKDADQVKAVKDAFKVDTSELDRREKQAEEDRRDAKKEVDKIIKRNAGMIHDPKMATVETDSAEILRELEDAKEFNKEGDRLVDEANTIASRADAQKNAIDGHKDRIKEIREELRLAEEKLESMNAVHAKTKTAAEGANDNAMKFPTKPTSDIEKRLAEVGKVNAAIVENNRIADAIAEYTKAEADRAKLEKLVVEIRDSRKKLLTDSAKAANFNFEGFRIFDDAIWIGDLPLRQLNTEKRLRFATRFGLVERPVMRIFSIEDGEKITPGNLKLIEEIANEEKTYIFTEIATTPDDIADGFRAVDFYLQEGRLVDIESMVDDIHEAREEKFKAGQKK